MCFKNLPIEFGDDGKALTKYVDAVKAWVASTRQQKSRSILQDEGKAGADHGPIIDPALRSRRGAHVRAPCARRDC